MAPKPSTNGTVTPDPAPTAPQVPPPPQEPDFDGPGSALRLAMWQRAQTFFDELERCCAETDEDAVHQVRVSSRRLSCGLDLITGLLGKKPVARARKRLRKLRKAMGDLRDLDIQLDWMRAHLEQLTHLSAPIAALERREAKLRSRAREVASSFSARALAQDLEVVDLLVAALVEGDEGWEDCLHMLEVSTRHRFAAVLARLAESGSSSPQALHSLRIAFKKFRYEAELVAPLLGETHTRNLGRFKEIQKALGNLQDLEVIARTLDGYWAQHTPDRVGQLAVLSTLLDQRTSLLDSFWSRAGEIEHLWDLPDSYQPSTESCGPGVM